MQANRLSQGQLIAAIAAIALFIISFLPWFSLGGSVSVAGTTIGGSINKNMWEFENPLDIYLLIVILVALAPAGLALLGGGDAPLAPIATTLLAGVGTLLIFYQLFDHGPSGVSIKIGLILGLIACGAITVGGWMQMQEDVRGERY